MIEKLNPHYSFTNPASIHDEEALTALELAGRQGSKINEVVTDQNKLRADMEHEKDVVIPQTIRDDVQKHIEDGDFDAQINEYAGELEQRLDNLLSIPEGSTTRDAEVIDGRVGADGSTYDTIGEATREQFKGKLRKEHLGVQVYISDTYALKLVEVASDNSILIQSAGSIALRSLIFKTIPFTTVLDNVGLDYQATASNGALCVKIPTTFVLVYDLTDNTFKVISRDAVDVNKHLIMLANVGGHVVGGKLSRYVDEFLSKGVSSRIDLMAKKDIIQAYLTDTYTLSLVSIENENEMFIRWSSGLGVRGSYNLTWTIDDAMNSVGMTYIGKQTIRIPHCYCFVFDTTEARTSALKVIPREDVTENQHILVANVGGHCVGGALEYYVRKFLDGSSGGSTPAGITVIPEECKDFCCIPASAEQGGFKTTTFLFFTDPHIVVGDDWTEKGFKYLDTVKRYAELACVDAVVCGGDWLNNGNTRESALGYLGAVNSYMRQNVKNYLPVIGNHDYNSQGATESDILTGAEVGVTINRPHNKGYYTQTIGDTTFIVLDTGIDDGGALTSYRLEQLEWLAQLLESGMDGKTVVVVMHMVYNNVAQMEAETPTPFASYVAQICGAFNSRTSCWVQDPEDGGILVNAEYSTLGEDGKPVGYVGAIVAGHNHTDKLTTMSGVPVLITKNATNYNDGDPVFDLVCVGVNTNGLGETTSVIMTVRVGDGENRNSRARG